MYTLVSLFSGAGGVDLGFKQAGYNIIWANDIDKHSFNTYKNNIGDHCILGNISNIPSSEIPDNIDVLIGGVPCQGFSTVNRYKKENDPRNSLYLEMIRVIKDKQPKIFIFENVRGLLSVEKGEIFKKILSDFNGLGYNISYFLFNTKYYNVPQSRYRIIIVGRKNGKKIPIENLPKADKIIPAKNAIGYLHDIPFSNTPIKLGDRIVYNHIGDNNIKDFFIARKNEVDYKEVSEYLKFWKDKSGLTNKKIYDMLGGNISINTWFNINVKTLPKPTIWWDLKKILHFDDKYDTVMTETYEKKYAFKDYFKYIKWNEPFDTVTGRTHQKKHVNGFRRVSLRELATIQSFPEDFVFYGPLTSISQQIGNAIPVEFARRIAEFIKDYI